MIIACCKSYNRNYLDIEKWNEKITKTNDFRYYFIYFLLFSHQRQRQKFADHWGKRQKICKFSLFWCQENFSIGHKMLLTHSGSLSTFWLLEIEFNLLVPPTIRCKVSSSSSILFILWHFPNTKRRKLKKKLFYQPTAASVLHVMVIRIFFSPLKLCVSGRKTLQLEMIEIYSTFFFSIFFRFQFQFQLRGVELLLITTTLDSMNFFFFSTVVHI